MESPMVFREIGIEMRVGCMRRVVWFVGVG